MEAKVKEYIERVTDERRALYDSLHEIVLGQYPESEVVFWYGLPTYRTKTGRLNLAFWKGGVTLSSYDTSHVVDFKAKHSKIKTGTVSISFKTSDTIPLESLKDVIKLAMEGGG